MYGGNGRFPVLSKYIFPGSVHVYIDSKKKKEGSDFTVNYYAGEVTFKSPPQQSNFYRILYEFSNPIIDYLPILARKHFLGTQYKKESQEKKIKTLTQSTTSETFIYNINNLKEEQITYNKTYLENIPSLNTDLYNYILKTLTKNNLLNSNLTIHQELSPTQSFTWLYADPKIASISNTVINSILKLNELTTASKQSFLSKFSNNQISPDFFLLLDDVSLADSITIFNKCIDLKLINSQGYIANNILTKNTLFSKQSSYHYLNTQIVDSLKLKFLDSSKKKPTFILKNSPIILGSEYVYLNNELLIKNKDYQIDNSLGILKINIPLLSTDKILVDRDLLCF